MIPGCVGRGVRLGSESLSAGSVWKSGNLKIWGLGNSESLDPTNQKTKQLKIKVQVAQNVSKVWISQKKIFPAPFGAISCNLFHGLEQSKKCVLFSLVGQWALFTRFGPLLLSTRGGEITLGTNCGDKHLEEVIRRRMNHSENGSLCYSG